MASVFPIVVPGLTAGQSPGRARRALQRVRLLVLPGIRIRSVIRGSNGCRTVHSRGRRPSSIFMTE
jgi:hypothetical protein